MKFVIISVLILCYLAINLLISRYWLQRDDAFYSGVRTLNSKKTLKYVIIAALIPRPFSRFYIDYIKAKHDPYLHSKK